MDIAIRPKIGKPWLLGVHQCSYLREWTAEEQRLFRDISYRITDALNNVLLHRDLQRSEEKYRSLFENSLDGIYRCTADGRFIDVNPALVRMLGYDSKDELLCAEAVAGLYFSEEDRQWWPIRSAAFPLRLRRKDGREIWIESNTQPIRGEDRDVLYYEGILRDVTDRRRAEAEMTRLLEENRKLTQQSIAIQEEERRSLARELHDELGQCLTAIKADGVSICLRSQDSLPQIFESASAIVSVSSHVYDVVRSMMRRLRPSMLDELGLVETLNDAIADWRARYPDATYRFTVSGNLDHLGEAINITVYRIVQECLTNVVKHAQASHVDIQLARESMATAPVPEAGLPKGVQGDCVRLVISDDGRGMNTSAYTAGLGILGMRERVQALNGSFSLQSSPGHGVCVSTVIPILH
jgi:PAS domain S-box-containing protein